MHTLFPVTIGEEWPRPVVLAFHFTSRRFHFAGPDRLSNVPSWFGPRQPGQTGLPAFPPGRAAGFGASGSIVTLGAAAAGELQTTGSRRLGGPARRLAILRASLGAIDGPAARAMPANRAQAV
jgi:hypothetical protein